MNSFFCYVYFFNNNIYDIIKYFVAATKNFAVVFV